MFNFFSKKAPKEQSRVAFAETFNYAGMEFTKACVYRACHIQDASHLQLTNLIGALRDTPMETTVDEICASSIATLASSITIDAAKKNDLEAVFLPTHEAPKHAGLLVAFSSLVTLYIHSQSTAEGLEIDFDAIAVRSALTFFPLWENDKALPHLKEGERLFKQICASEEENVRGWAKSLLGITTFYVQQFTLENQDAKEIDCEDAFGKLLKGVLPAIS